MRDLPVILTGLAAFLALTTSPFWYNALQKAPVRVTQAGKCIRPTGYMRRSHMEMLDAWRDGKVREGIREAGAVSLTHTCLEQCHGNTTQFCDSCHVYVGLRAPDCFECHGGMQPLPNGRASETSGAVGVRAAK